MKYWYFTLLLLIFPLFIQAQETTPQETEESIQRLQSEIDNLKKLVFSGYIQAQYQKADTMGVATFAGSNFKPTTDQRFALRRARLKATYTGNLTQYVFQIDVSERGFSIKDLYAKVSEPWLNTFSLTAGIMNRPFGFEIGYSSALRESPERGRMSQIIFPGERDLGAMITIQPPKSSPLNILKLETGFYNGNGTTSATNDGSEWDAKKDWISHLTIAKTFRNETIGLGCGVSFYDGGVRQGNKYVYTAGTLPDNTKGYLLDSTASNKFAYANRQYIGADAQLNLDLPIGLMTLRGEYIQGKQPGGASSSASATTDPIPTIPADPNLVSAYHTYNRTFNGAYLYFVWGILQSKHQVIVKYDWFDPNTKVQGDEINSAKKHSGADVKYSTLGLGWAYRWDNNVKLTAYYDLVKNETSANLASINKDLKDNVFTLRLQFRF